MTSQARTGNKPTGSDLWGAPLFLGGLAGALAAAGFYLGGWGLVLKSQGLGFHVEPALHHFLPGRQMGDRLHDKTVAFMQAEHPAILKTLEVGPQIAALLAGGLMFWMTLGDVVIATQDRHLSGRRHLRGKAALKAWVEVEGADADGLRIHESLPPFTKSRETRHLYVFGASGMGKTQFILPLMRAARRRGDRMIVFDFKGDFTPDFPSHAVAHKGQRVEVEDAIFAPWDRRSMPWAVAQDVDSLAAAREFAARMIPEAQGGSPFWSNAARQVLIASLVELQAEAPEKWGFADLAKKLIRPIDELAEAARIHFPEALKALSDGQQNVTSAGVLGNMMSYLSVIFDLSRAWPNPGVFSIRDWLTEKNKGTKSVILQHSGKFDSLAKAFNGAVIALARQLISSPDLFPDSSTRRLWFFLDEFPELGKVEAIFSLTAIGRSKGVRVVLGMQDISQLKDIYGEHKTNSAISMVGTHVITRVSPGDTADFISEKLLGKRNFERLDVSLTSGGGRSPGILTSGGTKTTGWKPDEKPTVPASYLLKLGPVKGKGVKVLVSGLDEDILEILIPFSDPRTLRPASMIADWTRFPHQPIVPAVATPVQEPPQPIPSWAEEAAEAEAAPASPLPVTPVPPAVTPVAHAKSDDIDGDEAGEGEESAPTPDTTPATDPLAFLGDGEASEKTPATELETRMLPIATPLVSQLADQAKGEMTESIGGELAQQVGIAALPAGIAEIAHAVEIADTLLDLGAGAAMPPTEVLPVMEAGVQPPRKKKIRLKKSATAQLEESI